MSKKQKGRRHRTVNRTPRPVSATRSPHRERPAAQPHTAAPTAGRVTPQPVAAVPAGRRAPSVPIPAPSKAAVVPSGPSGPSDGDDTESLGGDLGRHVRRTWAELREEGSSVPELADRAGYTGRTVLKHLTELAERGLAEQDTDGCWRQTGRAGQRALSTSG
ncbi:hypothetical protein [Streptomyces sp. NPDC051561]|uniref:hypothetical protein n=1 Tax=Streptomyces sp. NPDC051561 TaxID=3365658 RepID=UPI0037B136D4